MNSIRTQLVPWLVMCVHALLARAERSCGSRRGTLRRGRRIVRCSNWRRSSPSIFCIIDLGLAHGSSSVPLAAAMFSTRIARRARPRSALPRHVRTARMLDDLHDGHAAGRASRPCARSFTMRADGRGLHLADASGVPCWCRSSSRLAAGSSTWIGGRRAHVLGLGDRLADRDASQTAKAMATMSPWAALLRPGSARVPAGSAAR